MPIAVTPDESRGERPQVTIHSTERKAFSREVRNKEAV